MDAVHPADIDELREAVAAAAGRGEALEVTGGGSKRRFGRPIEAATLLTLDRLTGIIDYEPAELVLTARAGTPLSEIEVTLARHNQMLAFEPPDWRFLFGDDGAAPTIGGVIACNASGPRRLKAGAARDHFLGFRGVNGRAEIFKAGGKVLKNVTGYDLCKLMAGSFGTLAVMDEVTLKVLPRPETTRTIAVLDLGDTAAIATLSEALRTPHEVSAAAHLPASIARIDGLPKGRAITAVRIEGVDSSVHTRATLLKEMLVRRGEILELDTAACARFWRAVGAVQPLLAAPAGPATTLWRVSTAPMEAPVVIAAIARGLDAAYFYDWGGGLVWISIADAIDGGAAVVRRAIAATGGHATLVRAPEALRRTVPVFEPLTTPMAALTARVKESFDPSRLFNPGRMYADL